MLGGILQVGHRFGGEKSSTGLGQHPGQPSDFASRALSVAMPVFAYIWRYNFENSTKASRDFSDFSARERSQTCGRL